MLDLIVAEMLRVFEEMVVVVDEYRRYPWNDFPEVKVITDDVPDRGPALALEQALREISFEAAFACACDVPFVNGDLARRLCTMLSEHDAVIPRVNGKLQPLHAAYRKRCAKIFATMRSAGKHSLHEITEFANVRIVDEDEIRKHDPELRSFFNVNTPEDYQRAQIIADDGMYQGPKREKIRRQIRNP
jgi:molybdopterin-guanine dinucleotide biosynthesis protein A